MGLSAKEIMNNLAHESNLLKAVEGEEREKLQTILLSMMQDVHAVCEQNGLRYTLAGGTLLGAVRHKGYIPWDDDIDIIMPRSDWEKFKSIFEDCLGDNYILEAPNYGDKDTKATWGKIYKKDTILMELQDLKTPFCNGVFLDVFIMENVSNSTIVRYFDAKISDFMKGVATSMIYYKYPNHLLDKFYSASTSSYCYFKMRQYLGFLFSWCSHAKWCSWYDSFVSRHPQGEFVTMPTGRKNYMGEMLPSSVLEPLQLLKFEECSFYAFAEASTALENLYGKNYMQIPSEDKRERHFVYRLEI